MGNFNFYLPQIGIGALRRAAISAGALLALAAVAMGGSGEYNTTSAQGIGPDPEAVAPAPGGMAPGTNPGTQPPAMQEDPLGGNDPAGNPQQPHAVPETTTAGFGGYGLINGEHYPPGRFIIRYNRQPGPLGTVNEDSTATASTLLSEIEAQAIQAAVSEDLTTLPGGFDISNVEVTGGVAERNTYFVRADGDFDPLEVSFALNELEDVNYAHPDYYIEVTPAMVQHGTTSGDCIGRSSARDPNNGYMDPCADEDVGWYIDNINLDAAQDFVTRVKGNNDDPLVAVIDTAFTQVDPDYDARADSNGDPLTNPDLDGRWSLPNQQWAFWRKENLDTYGNGDSSPFIPGATHGSRVTSVLAGKKGNGFGAYGVYQGGPNTIMPLKITDDSELGDAELRLSAAIRAVSLANRHGAKIINGSISISIDVAKVPHGIRNACNFAVSDIKVSTSATVTGQAFRDEIAAFNGLFVAAAGNDRFNLGFRAWGFPQLFAQDVMNDNGVGVCVPKLDNLLNVAATQLDPSSGDVSLWVKPGTAPRDPNSGSNYSPDYVHIAAPGHRVFASNGHERRFSYGANRTSGTSLSAPQIAGTAALMLQVAPDLTPEQMIQILTHTGWHVPVLDPYVKDGKTLDAHAAVKCAHTLSNVSESYFEHFLGILCELPEFGFAYTTGSGDENRSWVEVQVSSKNGVPSTGNVPLILRWNNGTATAGSDYQSAWQHWDKSAGRWGPTEWWSSGSHEFHFPAGSTWEKYRFRVYDDTVQNEGDETVILSLSSPTDNATVRANSNRFTYTIRDNDHAATATSEFGFFGTRSSVRENTSSAYLFIDWVGGERPTRNIELTLDNSNSTATLSSDYSARWRYRANTANDWTYISYSNPQAVTFPANASWLEFKFAVVDDSRRESDEHLKLVLTTSDPSASITGSTYTYTIRDND